MKSYYEIIKFIWNKIEELENIKLNALLVYDNRYIKTKMVIKFLLIMMVQICNKMV